MKLDANALARNGGSAEVRRAWDAAEVQQPCEGGQGAVFDIISLGDFVSLKLPLRERVLSPIIPVRGLIMLFAARGVGKTHVAFGMSYAVSCGGSFLRWRAEKPRHVTYIDGEMPQEALQDRALALMAASPYQPPTRDHFRLLSMDRQALGTTVNLANPEHQAAVQAQIGPTELLVIDNLSTLVNGGPENDAESWTAMQEWLLQLRRAGVSVLVVHHAGRGGNSRGTSRREDVLDTVVKLKHPEDYEPDEGARFEVHLEKARGVYGDNALPFEAKLREDDGKAVWTCTVLRDQVLDRVKELTREGMTVRDIANELGVSKSKVNRMQAKLRDDGRLP